MTGGTEPTTAENAHLDVSTWRNLLISMSVDHGLVPVGSVITLVIWWSAEGVDDARRTGLGGAGRPGSYQPRPPQANGERLANDRWHGRRLLTEDTAASVLDLIHDRLGAIALQSGTGTRASTVAKVSKGECKTRPGDIVRRPTCHLMVQ